jgi:D-glycero-D-manno-heptose 1,7-bisphosphate phosphatase
MTSGRRSPALFLDRDGVINIDHGYVHRPDQFEFVPGIFELVRFAVHQLAWPVVVTTNQSGIGRSFFDEAAFQSLTDWMCDRFRQEQAPITRVYHCPYHPLHGVGAYRLDHDWRKPKPGMLLQAAADLNLDLPRSVLIGDRIDDVQAGAHAGVGLCIRVDAHRSPPDTGVPPHLVVRTLSEALSVLRRNRLPPGQIRDTPDSQAGPGRGNLAGNDIAGKDL